MPGLARAGKRLRKMTGKDDHMKTPVLTAEGKPWTQRCYVCRHMINFLKESNGSQWLKIGKFVRHKKCRPAAIR